MTGTKQENTMPASSVYQSIRRFFVKAPFAHQQDLTGKTVIVTGCAPGSIGFETARTLADWGATVIVTTRSTVEKTVQALRAVTTGGAVDGHTLDLASADSVAAFVAWFEKKYAGQLDILVNNAGIHLDLLSQWKAPQLTADGFEIQWRTNYLGTMHLTHLLLPLLQASGKKTGDARIVNVVSQLHSKGFNAGLSGSYPYNSWTAYGMSKLALVHATFELQRRYAATDHVQAYCLHPGAVFTNIADKGLAGNGWLQAVRHAMSPVERFSLLTPEEGAQTSIHCASHPDAAGGQYYQQCRPRAASADSADTAVAAQLWDKTISWIGSLDS
jgi:NAD(P)-dependent dehydrogenase (short-subunit alcohol dehydrogenase family)